MSDEPEVHDAPAVQPTRSKSTTGLLIMLLSPVLAISPFLIGIPLSKILCEQPANEGNCSWVALGWLGLLTIPAGAIMFFVGLILAVVGAAKTVGSSK